MSLKALGWAWEARPREHTVVWIHWYQVLNRQKRRRRSVRGLGKSVQGLLGQREYFARWFEQWFMVYTFVKTYWTIHTSNGYTSLYLNYALVKLIEAVYWCPLHTADRLNGNLWGNPSVQPGWNQCSDVGLCVVCLCVHSSVCVAFFCKREPGPPKMVAKPAFD